MNIYKVTTDAVMFNRHHVLAEDVEGAIKKAKPLIEDDVKIRDVEYVGEIIEPEK